MPNSDTEFVENKLGRLHNCIGELRKRGSKLGVATKTLEAGDYDFHITEQTPPQQGK
jgi:hypothetical protein